MAADIMRGEACFQVPAFELPGERFGHAEARVSKQSVTAARMALEKVAPPRRTNGEIL